MSKLNQNARKRLPVLAIVMILLVSTIPNQAAAETSSQSEPNKQEASLLFDGSQLIEEEELNEIKEFLSENGVSNSDQEELIFKLRSGVLWDSFNPAITPVSKTIEKRDSRVYTIERFQDGSIIVSGIDDLSLASNGAISPMTVYGCNYSGSAYAGYWKNCKTDVNYGIIRLGFTFNYENVRDVGSRITSYHTPFFSAIGGTMSNPTFNRRSSGVVRLTAQIIMGPVTMTKWVQANVSGNTAWSSHG